MPTSTERWIIIPESDYMICSDLFNCKPGSTSRSYTALVGRSWTGNQRRVRKKFNPPTYCYSRDRRSNTQTIKQGMCGCATKPAFASVGPLGPGSGLFGEQNANGANELRLRSKALARFVSNTGAGVTLLETRGSLRTLGDRLYGVTRILGALRKGDMRRALSILHQHTGYNTTRAEARLRANPGRNYADRASNFWLETVFGWIPLLQSVYDSLEVLGRDYRTTRRSRASDGQNELRAGIAAEFRTSDGNRFSKLGITNPAEILWDAVPFSFVLDWFMPIANSIRLLGVRSLTRQLWMWSSRKWGRRNYVSGYLNAPEGVWRNQDVNYQRSVLQPSVTTFTARLPDTMWHAVTSAALIQGLRPR